MGGITRRPIRSSSAALLLGSLPFLLSCADKAPTGPVPLASIEQLVGGWVARRSTFSVADDAKQRREVIAEGWRIALRFDATGVFRLEMVEPGRADRVEGVFALIGDSLILRSSLYAGDDFRLAFAAGLGNAVLWLTAVLKLESGDLGLVTHGPEMAVRWEMELGRDESRPREFR